MPWGHSFRDLWDRPWAPVGAAVLLAWTLRLPFIDHLPFPDEGGLLLVAGQWHSGGPELYGRLFVDRPPLLLLFFRLADGLGGLLAARLLGLLVVAGLVAAAGRVGWLLAGRRGATWSALAAAALVSNPVLGALEINAELLGVPLVMASCALALDGVRRAEGRRRTLLLVTAGLLAGSAPLVKQNLVDALVFAIVLVAGQAWHARWPGRRTAAALAGFALGAAVPAAATTLWATTRGPGLGVLWATLVQFRVSAAEVIAGSDSAATQRRLVQLPGIAALSGLLPLVGATLWQVRRRGEPVVLAAIAMLTVEVAGALLGGSYWTHYLIALVPGAVVLTGLAARLEVPSRATRMAVVGVVVSSAVSAVIALTPLVSRATQDQDALVAWLEQAHRPGDTGAVTFGHANILAGSGLRPGYRQLWSLPVRTLDPQLQDFTRQVRRPDGPVWIVEGTPLDTWGLDAQGRTQEAIDRHYRRVATVCGTPVYLRRGQARDLPPVPACG